MLKRVRRGRASAAARRPVSPFDRRGYVRSPITYPSYRRGVSPPNKGLRFPPEVLTPEEVFRLLAACDFGRYAATRNRALVIVGARAGLRCSEALSLYPKDVDLDRGRINVLRAKGRKHRVVAIDPGAAAVIRQWMDERSQLGFDGRHPVFCVMRGPSAGLTLNYPYVRALMKRLGQEAGIEKRVHYHGLRHTYASYLLDKGAPIHFIKRMLGHSSIAITEHYADHIGDASVLNFLLREVEWPALDHAAFLHSSQSEETA